MECQIYECISYEEDYVGILRALFYKQHDRYDIFVTGLNLMGCAAEWKEGILIHV